MARLQHETGFEEMVWKEATNNKGQRSLQPIRGLEGEVL